MIKLGLHKTKYDWSDINIDFFDSSTKIKLLQNYDKPFFVLESRPTGMPNTFVVKLLFLDGSIIETRMFENFLSLV